MLLHPVIAESGFAGLGAAVSGSTAGSNGPGAASVTPNTHGILPRRPSMRELSASDRLFLKSLRIAPDELPEVKG